MNPKTEVSEQSLFQDEQGFKDALIGVYTQMGAKPLYGKEFTMAFMDVLAQNYNVGITSNKYYQPGRYNYADIATKSTIDGFWNNSYKAIANINNLLAQIDAKKQVFSRDNYQIIKGEALALRAFLHFDLLRLFGPMPVQGLNSKGIPYLKSFKMNVRPFLTLTEVIDKCIQDLTESTRLLSVDKGVYYGTSDVFRSHTRNHMNYWSATGLMARIYLYKNDQQNALIKAKEVIDAKVFPFVTSAGISGAFPSRTFTSEHLFGLYVANLQDINAELFKTAANSSVLTNTTTFINSRFEVSNGGSTDYRYLFLWKTDGTSAAKYPIKYWSDDVSLSSSSIKRIPLIRLSEMYFIAAETTPLSADKINFLNEVRSHRGIATLPLTLTTSEIETELFKEYKKEFYQEGQLFYYYKRKNMSQIEGYGTPVGTAVYVLPVPDDEIEFNNQ
ncbi:RagB/SusD family nutrient uptake outer membrane protein [Pedobacter nyackensis]|uniref:RagB/SusD family nutrient uptake outer membrane protein n=1 Tax=Pedobacter nyackensis TaxID=475255 RepID=UPI00292D67B0|nr:RagB/SusD family nutrient uptake outer membrane protein [Pedobacter nyackensis]